VSLSSSAVSYSRAGAANRSRIAEKPARASDSDQALETLETRREILARLRLSGSGVSVWIIMWQDLLSFFLWLADQTRSHAAYFSIPILYVVSKPGNTVLRPSWLFLVMLFSPPLGIFKYKVVRFDRHQVVPHGLWLVRELVEAVSVSDTQLAPF